MAAEEKKALQIGPGQAPEAGRWSVDVARSYDGALRAETPHGKGTVVWEDGEKYEGQWCEGVRSGHGIKTLPDGREYCGEYQHDMEWGVGTATWLDGTRYEGHWVKGRPDGVGTVRYPDKSSYTGEWSRGVEHGRGRKQFPDKSEYDGQWLNGRCHGEGHKTFIDGRRYDGQFIRNTCHGRGRMVHPNGTIEEGSFADNKLCGHVVRTHFDGTRFAEAWVDGDLIKREPIDPLSGDGRAPPPVQTSPSISQTPISASEVTSKGTPFTIVQFNVLGRSLALTKYFSHAYCYIPGRIEGWKYFDTSIPEHLAWESRKGVLLKEVVATKADILCMEEMDAYEDFNDSLSLHGYGGLYSRRPNGRKDGCAIWWKEAKFRFVESETVCFDSSLVRHDLPESNRIALIIRLLSLAAEKEVVVVCTHLYWDSTRSDVQKAEISALFDQLRKPAYSKKAIVIAGDLNCSPDTETYRHIMEAEAQHSLASAYKTYYGHEPPYTTVTPDTYVYEALNAGATHNSDVPQPPPDISGKTSVASGHLLQQSQTGAGGVSPGGFAPPASGGGGGRGLDRRPSTRFTSHTDGSRTGATSTAFLYTDRTTSPNHSGSGTSTPGASAGAGVDGPDLTGDRRETSTVIPPAGTSATPTTWGTMEGAEVGHNAHLHPSHNRRGVWVRRPGKVKTIDYILYTSHSLEVSRVWRLAGRHELLTGKKELLPSNEQDLDDLVVTASDGSQYPGWAAKRHQKEAEVGIPNDKHGSDHLPLKVEFSIPK